MCIHVHMNTRHPRLLLPIVIGASALVTLAADPELRRAMGEAGRLKMHAEYSRDTHRDALLAVYRELLP